MSIFMQQYKAIKAKYPDAILLFRVGDFYESFNEDAKIMALHLGNTLTFSERMEGITEMASIPHYSLDTALQKLVRAGYRVAVCDPLEEPKPAPSKQGVSEIFRPPSA
jgi:DNA mismatch repair protein MutS